ncbi:MAG: MFS transporter [Candidatus Nealsonbacteria bacterium]|nr:MAG: MFS transporter [Candidatus Nealsonbacteria bacterium]
MAVYQYRNKIREYQNKIGDTLGPPKFSFDVIFLFLNNLTWRFALWGMIALFLPIFLFERFNQSVQNVLIFYIVSGVLFGFLVPLGAKIMSKIGLKKSMILATPFLVAYCLTLYYFASYRLFVFLIFAILTITLFRILYWTPYHVEFAKFTSQKDRGRQIAYLSSFGFIIGVIAPLLAGLIIDQLGFPILFIISMIIIAISIFPLFFLSQVKEEYSFSYFQTFKEAFSRKNRRLLIGYGSDGAQSIVSVVIWPIFIFGILNENYVAVGGITAAVILVTIILNLVMGTLADIKKKRFLIKIGSGLYAFGWLIKMFVASGFQIFVVSAYHSFTGIIRGIPFTTFVYEQMADQGHYIDEYTVLREVSLNVGRVLMLIACFILLGFVGLTWTFLLAAIASLFINIL